MSEMPDDPKERETEWQRLDRASYEALPGILLVIAALGVVLGVVLLIVGRPRESPLSLARSSSLRWLSSSDQSKAGGGEREPYGRTAPSRSLDRDPPPGRYVPDLVGGRERLAEQYRRATALSVPLGPVAGRAPQASRGVSLSA